MLKFTVNRVINRLAATALYMFMWVMYFRYLSLRFQCIPGYYFEDVSFYKYFLVLPFILLISLFISLKVSNITDIIFISSFYIVYYPLFYISFPRLDILIPVFLNISITIFLWDMLKSVNLIVKNKEGKENYFFVFLLVIIFTIIFIRLFGFKTQINYISSLYEIRSEFNESTSGVRAYIFILAEYLIIPLSLYLLFNARRSIYKILGLIVAFILSTQVFFISALKSALFIIPFLVLGYFLLKASLKNKGSIYLDRPITIFSLLVFLSIISITFFKIPNLFRYLIEQSLRRFLVSPPVNAYYHILYTIEQYGWFNVGNRRGIMGNIISEVFYGTNGNAPAGLIADALSRNGILFFITFPFIYLFSLFFLRNIVRNLSLPNQFLLFGFYVYVLTNTSLLTAQITYGMFLMIAIVWIMNNKFKLLRTEPKSIKHESKDIGEQKFLSAEKKL
jgi:hypothetical protein